ncbi:hypothetical protein MJK72_13740 [Klebsiella pneumoniae]|nr:hypothetical protein MJK72_13740 [Klebsiella pneumoniae]
MNASKISHTVELPEAAHRPLKGGASHFEAWRNTSGSGLNSSYWLYAMGINYHAGDTDNGAGQRFKNQPDDHPRSKIAK